jgi:hypothetical protein
MSRPTGQTLLLQEVPTVETDTGAMTEPDWFSASSPETMLKFLQDQGFVSERKLRLFAVACCRQVWHQLLVEDSQTAIEMSEKFADGRATLVELRAANMRAELRRPFIGWSERAKHAGHAAIQCSSDSAGTVHGGIVVASTTSWALRPNAPTSDYLSLLTSGRIKQADLVRDIFPNPFRPINFDPSWRTETVQLLSRSMYESRDFSPMSILADALMDVGCNELAVLEHCRSGGPHVRGCFVVDWCLDKS